MKKLTLLLTLALSVAAYAQLPQVWDLGAEQFDAEQYENMLSVDEINSWFSSTVEVGSTNNTISNITASDGVNFLFNGGGKSNHRLRTTNTALTCFDRKSLKDADQNVYTGYIYSNSTSTSAVYIEQTYAANDILEFYVGSNGNPATYEVLAPNSTTQQLEYTKAAQIEKLTYYPGVAGKYRLYCTNEKLVVARIVRTPAKPATLSGSITAPAAIPADYTILFTNLKNGNEVEVVPAEGQYTATLALGFDYKLSLKGANGFIIDSANPITISQETQTNDITISAVELVTLTGTISGLPADQLAKLEFRFAVPEDKVFEPEFTIDRDAATFTLVLEKGVTYAVEALNVNDYQPAYSEVKVDANQTGVELAFTLKPLYDVTIVPTGATLAELASAVFTFTRLDDEYVYTFTGTEEIKLRDGIYTVKVTETGIYSQLLTANLHVNGAPVSKTIDFSAEINSWNFSDADFTEGGYTATSETYTYKTLQFSGCKSHNSTYLYAGNGAEVKVPVKGNSLITVNACYEYHLFVGETVVGDASTGSTSQIDALTYAYEGEAGYVTFTAKGTCYINSISVARVVPYKETLTVGEGKDFSTINAAIEEVESMSRTANQHVTILIEPGNYEEMLRIHADNITLKNAAPEPSLALKDAGVNIDDNAVRITSYYGHGYNYYSMNSDYRWDARTLAVNKENGYESIVNSGGSSATHWNSTVVVYGKDFTAEGIIFENSYNQYISKKESEDVVVEGKDSKGPRPTDIGNTAVQNRSFRERACAIAFAKGSDRALLKNCRVVGRQDAIYGDNDVRVAIDGGILNGACDYIFGGMTLAVYQAELAMLVTSDKNDVAYLTASKTDSGKRGYLFYECSVTSAIPGTDMAETQIAQPGYLGRPWAATAETVFFGTKIASNEGVSLILPIGWSDGLTAGGSNRSYEYASDEEAEVDNSSKRAGWASVLAEPKLPDGTELTLLNFTKGNDNWEPLVVKEPQAVEDVAAGAKATKLLIGGQILILRDGKCYNALGMQIQ